MNKWFAMFFLKNRTWQLSKLPPPPGGNLNETLLHVCFKGETFQVLNSFKENQQNLNLLYLDISTGKKKSDTNSIQIEV